jgi:hypothetical protein
MINYHYILLLCFSVLCGRFKDGAMTSSLVFCPCASTFSNTTSYSLYHHLLFFCSCHFSLCRCSTSSFSSPKSPRWPAAFWRHGIFFTVNVQEAQNKQQQHTSKYFYSRIITTTNVQERRRKVRTKKRERARRKKKNQKSSNS